MNIPFTKMHGAGNDFVVLDATRSPLTLSVEQARRIADRHFGIGCDQILLVEPPPNDGVDFRYRILNADGSEVSQCGNGARCFARYVSDKGLTVKRDIRVVTAAGEIVLHLRDDDQVRVNMGVPRWAPDQIPCLASARAEVYQLTVDAKPIEFGAVSMGNPHLVMRVDDVATAPVLTLGPTLESHPFFPQRVNVGFMQVVDANHIRLRVFERGSGETLACGSGACAAVVVGQQRGWLATSVAVTLPGGTLEIEWAGEGNPVYLTGPAVTVYEGMIEL